MPPIRLNIRPEPEAHIIITYNGELVSVKLVAERKTTHYYKGGQLTDISPFHFYGSIYGLVGE